MTILITALRGFKVRPSTLDLYVNMNGEKKGTSFGRYPPQYQFDDRGGASDAASNTLRERAAALGGDSQDSSGILVVLPFFLPHDESPWAYVAYSYTFVYSQLHITTDSLPERVPRGFEELRQEMLEDCTSGSNLGDEGLMGFYIVRTDDQACPMPAELKNRYTVRPGWF